VYIRRIYMGYIAKMCNTHSWYVHVVYSKNVQCTFAVYTYMYIPTTYNTHTCIYIPRMCNSCTQNVHACIYQEHSLRVRDIYMYILITCNIRTYYIYIYIYICVRVARFLRGWRTPVRRSQATRN